MLRRLARPVAAHAAPSSFSAFFAARDYNSIAPKELRQRIETSKENLVFIDVRPQEEIDSNGGVLTHKGFEAHTLPLDQITGALSLDAKTFSSKYGFDKPDPAKDTLVLSCRSGKRSASACEIAEAAGYKKVYNHTGGALAWHAPN